MPDERSLASLPPNLPVPVNDGAAAHLAGMVVPWAALQATTGGAVNPAALPGRTVIYCYPLTGRPGVALPSGWDQIPGARGCTPESCAFRDHHAELSSLGASVYGLSTQDTDYQREVAARLHLPFALLSDARLVFADALRLPTFELEGQRLLKRLTLVISEGVVEHVFYPVFPPDTHATAVLAWLTAHISV